MKQAAVIWVSLGIGFYFGQLKEKEGPPGPPGPMGPSYMPPTLSNV